MSIFHQCEVDFVVDEAMRRLRAGRLLALAALCAITFGCVQTLMSYMTANSEARRVTAEAELTERLQRVEAEKTRLTKNLDVIDLRTADSALAFPWAEEFRALDVVSAEGVAVLSWSADRSSGEARIVLGAESAELVTSSLLRLGSSGAKSKWFVANIANDAGNPPLVVRATLVRSPL